jgi:hypothetical protein
MISCREKIRSALLGKHFGIPPASVRLELWHADAVSRGTLPAKLKGMTIGGIEDSLGFVRSSRFRNYVTISGLKHPMEIFPSGDEKHTVYKFPSKHLTGVTKLPAEMAAMGMSPIHVKYPVETLPDYGLMADFYRGAAAEFREDDFKSFDADTGDKGLPMLIINSNPAHEIMLNLTGYERFYLDWSDNPEAVRELLDAMDSFYREKIWPAVAKSSARLVLHGNHFSGQLTPPPVFEKLFLPYFKDFCRLMHDCGKLVAFHADAGLGPLTPLIPAAGFDIADCLATAPLVNDTIDDYLWAWGDKVVCWGGLPSTIFTSQYSFEDYKKHVDILAEKVSGRANFIFGASDNVMPGTEWERLEYLSRVVSG